MSIHTDKRLLVVSCRGAMEVFDAKGFSTEQLANALFYLDCPKSYLFHDCGVLSAPYSHFGALEGAIAARNIIGKAVRVAKKEHRAAWRNPRVDNRLQINRLLKINGAPELGPTLGPQFSNSDLVDAALNDELPYYIIWEKLLQYSH